MHPQGTAGRGSPRPLKCKLNICYRATTIFLCRSPPSYCDCWCGGGILGLRPRCSQQRSALADQPSLALEVLQVWCMPGLCCYGKQKRKSITGVFQHFHLPHTAASALLRHEFSKVQTRAGVLVISLSLWPGVSPDLCSKSSFALQCWKEGATPVARIYSRRYLPMLAGWFP